MSWLPSKILGAGAPPAFVPFFTGVQPLIWYKADAPTTWANYGTLGVSANMSHISGAVPTLVTGPGGSSGPSVYTLPQDTLMRSGVVTHNLNDGSAGAAAKAPITLVAWVKTNVYTPVVSFGDDSYGGYPWGLYLHNAIAGCVIDAAHETAPAASVGAGPWRRVVATVERTISPLTLTMKFYRDGAFVGSVSAGVSSSLNLRTGNSGPISTRTGGSTSVAHSVADIQVYRSLASLSDVVADWNTWKDLDLS